MIEEVETPLLYGRTLPPIERQKEAPAHRLMLELSARGNTVSEIAAKTGFTTVTVNQILRQPYAQKTLVEAIRRVADEDNEVVEIVKGTVVDAAKLIKQTISDPGVKRETRLAAAEMAMSRRYGKPNQPINKNDGIDLDSLSIADIAKHLPTTQATGTGNAGPAERSSAANSGQ